MRDGDVQYAEPDILFKKAAIPNEPRYTQWQWNLFAPATAYTSSNVTVAATGGANLPGAWDLTNGSSAVTIAVIDTGITNHQELNGIRGGATYTPAGRFLPGYDFVSSNIGTGLPANFIANDGDGRDADPTDPGDWITATGRRPIRRIVTTVRSVKASRHGMAPMSGVAAATANNAEGMRHRLEHPDPAGARAGQVRRQSLGHCRCDALGSRRPARKRNDLAAERRHGRHQSEQGAGNQSEPRRR
jgi:serine protease